VEGFLVIGGVPWKGIFTAQPLPFSLFLHPSHEVIGFCYMLLLCYAALPQSTESNGQKSPKL
jgi:hypothetical protein